MQEIGIEHFELLLQDWGMRRWGLLLQYECLFAECDWHTLIGRNLCRSFARWEAEFWWFPWFSTVSFSMKELNRTLRDTKDALLVPSRMAELPAMVDSTGIHWGWVPHPSTSLVMLFACFIQNGWLGNSECEHLLQIELFMVFMVFFRFPG